MRFVEFCESFGSDDVSASLASALDYRFESLLFDPKDNFGFPDMQGVCFGSTFSKS